MEIIKYDNTSRFKVWLLENIDTILLTSFYALSFSIPFLIEKPQILVGMCINLLITISTLKFGLKKTIPILILPSLSAYLHGILFNGATIFLLYLIPFIILSNLIYSSVIYKVGNKYISVILGSFLKTVFLFSVANIFVNSFNLPTIFLTTMGINQLITALTGGILAVIFYDMKNNSFVKNIF